jgi:hypothetical protein
MDPTTARQPFPVPRTARLEVRLTPPEHSTIADRARQEGRTVSDMVRILLQRGMAR